MCSLSAERLRAGLLALLGAALLLVHLAAISRESVNWDEFALVWRVAETLRTGQLQAGGREGLVVFVLLPFVTGCGDAIEAITRARWLWAGFTLGALAGLYALVRSASGRAGAAPALAVGLLALVPVFLRWSLQVRTDQPCLALALWGSVALLASQRRPAWSALAGLLFGVAYLFTQKAAYVLLLGGILAVGRIAGERWVWRRELLRGALLAAAAVAAVAAYRRAAALAFFVPAGLTIERGLGELALYRGLFGYRVYAAMLNTLLAHGLLLGLLAAATLGERPKTRHDRVRLALCWALLAAGLLVGAFHGSAFPYFWMTLGLFPAVSLALAWGGPIAAWLERRRGLALAAVWGLLLLSSLPAAAALLRDSQAVQRRAFAFVARSFAPADRGFQAEGALACRADPAPFPVYFSSTIVRMYGEEGRPRVQALLEDFRRRPPSFLIAHRFMPFPKPVEDFWRENYVLYRDEVLIPGRRVQGERGAAGSFEAIVDGEYRWHPESGGAIRIDGVDLGPGKVRWLAAGTHTLDFPDSATGLIALAVADGPAPSREPFYDRGAVREIDPPR